jgi:hypothetical protein
MCRASDTSTAGATRRTKAGCAPALDYYKIPYTYFGENEVGKRDLKQFDVILWPSGGSVGQDPPTTGTPIPYKKAPGFDAIGAPDST